MNLCFWRPAWRGASASPKVLGGSLGHLPPGEGDRRARALLPNLKVLKKNAFGENRPDARTKLVLSCLPGAS